MDNLLEFIILAVFILSGINSLFGNKKKRREKMENQNTGQRPVPIKKKVPQDEMDLLQEFFGIKKEKTYPTDPFEEPSMQNSEYNNTNYNAQGSWNPEDDYKDDQNIKLTDVEERQKIFNEISKIDYDKVVPVKSYLEEVAASNTSGPTLNRRVIEIRRVLKNKKSIKDSIIIADILNKPKAYRPRGNDPLR